MTFPHVVVRRRVWAGKHFLVTQQQFRSKRETTTRTEVLISPSSVPCSSMARGEDSRRSHRHRPKRSWIMCPCRKTWRGVRVSVMFGFRSAACPPRVCSVCDLLSSYCVQKKQTGRWLERNIAMRLSWTCPLCIQRGVWAVRSRELGRSVYNGGPPNSLQDRKKKSTARQNLPRRNVVLQKRACRRERCGVTSCISANVPAGQEEVRNVVKISFLRSMLMVWALRS